MKLRKVLKEMYLKGKLTKKDYKKELKWIRKRNASIY